MDDIEEIKKRINIVELISGYLQLKKAGANHKGLCPFHNEDTPSFMVSEEKEIWHCFGCGEGGDIFTFIEKIEGLEFADALKFLAARAGVKLKRQNIKAGQEKVKLSDINEAAANFYHQVLLHPKVGKRALAYLKKRGIKEQTIKDFQIGYAPNSWEATYKALTKKKNYKGEDLERGGVVIKSTRSSANPYYDRFRGRIMFPIRNIAGTCLGFSGRTLEKNPGSLPDDRQEPKYLNTPETPIFNKSEIIYGLDLARTTIREKNFVIIVEGQMDVVSAHQAGFKFVVATSGTALTRQHIEVLKKYTENIAFCFDTDSAGEKAAKRAIETANLAGVNAKMVILPSGEDPDSIIKKNKSEFIKAIKNAKNAMEFYIMAAFKDKKLPLLLEDKRAITKELLPQIKKISDPVIQGEYIQKLSQKLGLDEKYLYESLEKINETHNIQKKDLEKTKPPFSETLEERILAFLILFPQIGKNFIKKIETADFKEKGLSLIYTEIKKLYNKGDDVKGKIANSSSPLIKKINILVLKMEDEFAPLSEKEIFEEIGIEISRLKSLNLEKVKKDFEEKIRQAESSDDKEKVKKLIRDFQTKIMAERGING